jgi:hypothetical protein
MRTLIRLVIVALLGATAAALVSCGSSGNGLIPSSDAGPLRSDFEEVARAAAAGNGSCRTTEAALGKTEQDFLVLPTSVNRGLRARLESGIANLHKQALAVCAGPSTTATGTTSTQTTTPTTTKTTTTSTETTPTTTPSTTTTTTTGTQTTPTTTTPPGPSGGTEASGEASAEEGAGKGKGKDEGNANGGGSGAGGASPGGGQ